MIHSDLYTYGKPECRVTARVAAFVPSGGTGEYHAVLHVVGAERPFAEQLAAVRGAFGDLCGELRGTACVMCRLFLSDAAAQQRAAAAAFDGIPLSIVQQPPLDGGKMAVWAVFQEGMEPCGVGAFRHGGYTHRYVLSQERAGRDSYAQTAALLEDYERSLASLDMNVADHCVRTWFFVRDVDVNYQGVVDARRENFAACGLTEKTHYIASTGIEGKPDSRAVFVRMDAYAVEGLEAGQQRYLYAKDHLNPTYEYGVTFERGVRVEYGDRRHYFISGTASIDNRGEVVHVGDIRRQTERMWENVEALLAEGGAGMDDIASMIVYLRDTADYRVVRGMFENRWPDKPAVITLAPVCRPDWLVEMECIALTGDGNAKFRAF